MSEKYQDVKNWLEWAVFGLGCLLMLGTVGSLGYEAWTDSPDDAPRIEVELGEASPLGAHYAVPVKVYNRGAVTAEGVLIEVTLVTSDGDEERGEFEVQFLPRHALREGRVLFETNPARAANIKARPLGYEQP